jgi:undecaprenyl-diphosphatase
VLTSRIESVFERPVVASFLLGVNGWLLLTAESHYEERDKEPRGEDTVDTADAITVGLAQTTALLPGISRSGTTISAGMLRGLSREAAMVFSFLLAVPITVGAIIVEIPDIAREGASGAAGAMVVGIVAAAITGVVAIRAMLGLVARKGLRPFGIYCILAMTAGLLTALARG